MARNANTFPAKYTRAQRDAAVKAVIVDGLTSKEASRRAAAGKLPGHGKFEISHAYIRKLVGAERQRISPRELVKPGEAEKAIEQARANALALILRALERWTREAKTGHLDLAEHGRLMRALREHERQAGPGRQRAETGQGNNTTDATQGDAQALLAALAERARDGSSVQTSNGQSAASLSRRASGQPEPPSA